MKPLNRREILKGVSLGAGAMFLTPMLQQLQAQASGSAHLPRRFVFVLEGNGFNPDQARPAHVPHIRGQAMVANSDTLRDIPLGNHELPFALQPLEAFRNRMCIVQGLSGRICGGGHSNNFGALGVYPGKQDAYGETIDIALSRALPATFPQVGLGIADKVDSSIIYNVSAAGRGRPMPTVIKPDQAYANLFGSIAPGNGRSAFDTRTNLLDTVREDLRSLENQLAGEERQRLGSYVNAFETMRNRQADLLSREAMLRRHAPQVSKKYTSIVETERLEAMFDIGGAALVCGLTNVLTIASGSGDPYFGITFSGLGINLGKHGIGHGGSYNGVDSRTLSARIRRFHLEQVAKLARQLDAIPEGNGTMLDNTLIVYLSDSAEQHHSRCYEWPFLLLGNLGGRLKTAGRYLEYPRYGRNGHRTIANLYCTFLHAAGVRQDEFGVADPALRGLDQRGPLSELLI